MQAEHTDALYYPYINIRNIDWLKATLLIFPHILRMVPNGEYRQPSSDFLIDELSNTLGTRGQPLVGEYNLERPAIAVATNRFCESIKNELKRDRAILQTRFCQESAKDFGLGNDSKYQIHRGKVTGELGALLQSEGLMWRPNSSYGARYEWWAVHPLLGEALMSCFAVAAAKDAGCEIVTDDPSLHHAVSEIQDDAMLSHIKDRYQHEFRPSLDTTIAQLVILNTFDIRSLSLKNLVLMAKEEDALYAFRTKIAKIAETIPTVEDPKRQEAYVKEAADKIIEEWLQSRGSMSQFARHFFGFSAVQRSESAITALARAMAAPATTGIAAMARPAEVQILATAFGLAVGVAYYAANELISYRSAVNASPLRYLSLIANSGSNVSFSKTLTIKRRSGR